MNSQKCPHSAWWLVFIAGVPILSLACVLYLLSQPVDPWAAGAYWSVVIVFYGAPSVLIPLVCGIFTCFSVWCRKATISRCLLLALLPSALILTVSLILFFYTSMQSASVAANAWQSRVYSLPLQERDPIQQYLAVQEMVLSWVDASNPQFNYRLLRLSANAEACLRQKLPNLQSERIYVLNQWIHVGETSTADEKAHALWQEVLEQYQSDYQEHRLHCDAALNFKTVEKLYPNG